MRVSTTSRIAPAWRQGDPWTVTDAAELYEIERWGKHFFSIGPNGHVRVHATKETGRSIDLKQLVDHLQLRGIGLPILIRFRETYCTVSANNWLRLFRNKVPWAGTGVA